MSNGVTQNLQEQPVCEVAQSRLNKAVGNVNKLCQKPDINAKRAQIEHQIFWPNPPVFC